MQVSLAKQPGLSELSAPSLGKVAWGRVVTCYVAVYIASCGLVAGFRLAGGNVNGPSWIFFLQVSSLMPALVAMALARWRWHEPLVPSLALRLRAGRWLAVAWLSPWALALLAGHRGLRLPS